MGASVAALHAILDALVADGVQPAEIVLGGFSQGGAIALSAGLSYSKPLGGLVSISGWCVRGVSGSVASIVHPSNAHVPVWFSCGTAVS